MIEYAVRLADLNQHLIEIECRIKAPREIEHVSLPSWIPGSYLLREYARHVVSICARSDDEAPALTKVDSSTWAISGARSAASIVIRIHGLDLSVRGAYLDDSRGYFNGTCVFLRVHGREGDPAQVTFERPTDQRCAAWQLATAMTPVNVDARGFGRYSVENYDELIDHPVEISAFVRAEFVAANTPHSLVIAGRHETDIDRLTTDLRQLCETQIDFFGAPAPFDHYLFLGLAVAHGYGGLEHRASSSLVFNADDLPKPGELGMPREYQRFLSLCSHEYFHAWNIKRLKPAAFSPYRLNERNYTRQLWVFEGITSYYQDLMLLRADLIGQEAYLSRLAKTLTRVYRSPGRAYQSLAESSFDAWDRLYKPEPNSGNATISYYTKGALVALALDLTVRKATGSAASLDDIMKTLWNARGRHGSALCEDDFERVAAEVAGTELQSFFDRAVRGTDDLPLAELLDAFGVTLTFRAATSPTDVGGPINEPELEPGRPLTLGARFRDNDGGVELASVREGGPAEAAGLCAGDLLVALDGRRIRANELPGRLARFKPGETVALAYFRRDELRLTQIVLAAAPLDTCCLALSGETSVGAAALRSAWLGR